MVHEPTDLLSLKVWWAFTWRAVLFAMLAGALAGLVIGIIGTSLGESPENLQGPSTFAGAVLGLFISVRVFRRLMTNGFGRYKLVVVDNDA